LKKLLLFLLTPLVFTGCMGTSGLTGKVKKFNLEVVEHRWAREGTFLALNILWVYRVCSILDLLVFNSIEFWSGENPINGKSPLVDLPMETVQKMGMNDVQKAQIERLNASNAKMYIHFDNGDKLSFDVVREESNYTVSYLGKKFFTGSINNMNTASN
jgi:hypothetical protein